MQKMNNSLDLHEQYIKGFMKFLSSSSMYIL